MSFVDTSMYVLNTMTNRLVKEIIFMYIKIHYLELSMSILILIILP